MKEKYILRKVYLSAVAVLLSIGWAAGQPRAVSVRLGWISELSYQHTLGPGHTVAGCLPDSDSDLQLHSLDVSERCGRRF